MSRIATRCHCKSIIIDVKVSRNQSLKRWKKLPKLGQHPLAKLQIVEQKRRQGGYEESPAGYGAALRGLLRQHIQKLRPNGEEPSSYQELNQLSGAALRHWQHYLIVAKQYIERKQRKYIRENWDIAQGTYNTRQKEVFEHLGNLLREEERHSSPLPQPTPVVPVPREVLVLPVPREPLFVGVPQKPPYFVGRDDLVEELSMQLMKGKNVALQGLAGVGKTTLAVMLANNHALLEHFSDGVLWGSLGPEPNVLRVLGRWGKALGGEVSHLRGEAERAQAVKDAIGQRRMLLVIDDAWDVEAAKWLRVGGPYCAHLLTTRDLGITRAFRAQAITVPALAEESAFDLLQRLAPDACAADPIKAQELVRSVGGLPLAIDLLGGYLAAPEHSLFPELAFEALDEMSDPYSRLQLASQRLGSFRGLEVTLQETIQFSLANLSPPTVAAFHALGAFAPKPADFELEAAKAVTAADARTLAILAARHLIERTSQRQAGRPARLALHQTLADVAQTNLEQNARKRHRQYYLTLAQANGHPKAAAWDKLEEELPNLLLAAQRSAKAKDLDGMIAFEEALIHQGQLLYIRGYYQEAIDLLSLSLAVQKVSQPFGRENPSPYQARTLNKQAFFYNRLNQSKSAQKKAQDAYRLAVASHDQEQQADSLKYLGQIFSERGHHKRAHECFEKELTLRHALDKRSELANCFNSLGLALLATGNFTEARRYFDEAIHFFKEMKNSFRLVLCYGNRGLPLLYMGDYASAMKDFEISLEQSRKLDARYTYTRMLLNKGVLHSYLNEYSLALQCLTDALPLWRKIKRQSGEALTLGTLAEVYSALGDFQQARAYLEEAHAKILQIENKEVEVDHLNKWGLVEYEEGHYEEALEAYREAAALLEESNLRCYALAQNKLGLSRTYLAKGSREDLEQARHHAREAITLCQQMHLAGNEPLAHAYLAKANLRLGDHPTALKNGRQAIRLLEKQAFVHGSEAEIYLHMVDILLANRQTEEAAPYIQSAAESIQLTAHKIEAQALRQRYLASWKSRLSCACETDCRRPQACLGS